MVNEACLIAVQQVVEIVKNECAHTIEKIGDTAHDELLVDEKEDRVVHAAVLVERREQRVSVPTRRFLM